MIKLKVEPQHMKGPGINIHGKHITEAVHELFSYSIGANMVGDRFYEARKKAGAFFQGGSDKPAGEWVFIEFWNPTQTDDYVNLLQEHLNLMSDDGEFVELIVKPKDLEKSPTRLRWLFDFYETAVVQDGENYRFTPSDMMFLIALTQYGSEGVFDIEIYNPVKEHSFFDPTLKTTMQFFAIMEELDKDTQQLTASYSDDGALYRLCIHTKHDVVWAAIWQDDVDGFSVSIRDNNGTLYTFDLKDYPDVLSLAKLVYSELVKP